jgi:hypothetical protein
VSGRDAVLRRKKMKKNSGFLVMFSVLALAMAALMGACSDVSRDDRSNGIDESFPKGWEFSSVFPVENEAQLRGIVTYITNREQPGNYLIILKKDIPISGGDITLKGTDADKTIVICGDGQTCTITNEHDEADVFIVRGNNTLVLDKDVTLDGGKKEAVAVKVDGGALVMNTGSKITNVGESGVWVENTGAFTMEGGEISGNTGNILGGGVVLYGGTFMMKGGEISGNTAPYGGGVFVAEGTFMMTGGTISGNTTTGVGGGVHVNEAGTFTMTGGTISGNTAGNGGGGVYVNNEGGFKKTGGTIYGYTGGDNSISNIVGTRGENGVIVGFEPGYGHAVYVNEVYQREGTVGPGNVLIFNIEGHPNEGWDASPEE